MWPQIWTYHFTYYWAEELVTSSKAWDFKLAVLDSLSSDIQRKIWLDIMLAFWDQFKAYILGTRLFFPIDFILNLLQDTDEQLKIY